MADMALASAAMRLMVARCTRKMWAISAPVRPGKHCKNLARALSASTALSALFTRRFQPGTGSLAHHKGIAPLVYERDALEAP